MAYRIRSLSPDESPLFGRMTFPAYRARVGNGALAVGLYSGRQPAGLALIAVDRDQKMAELLSLYVDRPYRARGLGSTLLSHAEFVLARANVPLVHTVWSGSLPGAAAFEGVLAKSGWSAPHKRMITLRGDMAGDFGQEVRDKYPKYASPDCLPRKYRLTRWGDMTRADRLFIRSKQGQPNWHEHRADPFREEQILERDNSLILRQEDEIVGWLTVHRTAPDVLRYTDVFIRADLKRAGAVSIAMVTHAFWLQLAEGTPTLTMATEKDNEPLLRMYQKRMSCSQLTWTWGAEKKLG
jgi:GNAT superfamily N-acetyltransferase